MQVGFNFRIMTNRKHTFGKLISKTYSNREGKYNYEEFHFHFLVARGTFSFY